MMTFQEIRQKNNLTQAELGKIVNCKQVTISQYENGQRKPDILTLQKLAIALNVSLEVLCEALRKKNEVS